jgi:bifunctional UDP-N-acetylglucosamine pyrophosphorylase/glucosamine-1-phosphate N-acetyltransferase
VEVKNSVIGEGSRAKHLSYMGDSVIGKFVNIGAGMITCNYDGRDKHKTEIGNDVFVGANTTLIAPIKIGDNAVVAAGSTLTESIDEGSLGIARPRQQEIKGYKNRKKEE